MMKLKSAVLSGIAMAVLSTSANARVHETFLHDSSIYVGAEFVFLSHSPDILESSATSNHVEVKGGKEFYDGHHVELFYLLPSDIDDTAARFKSLGARYAVEFDIDRRWKLMRLWDLVKTLFQHLVILNQSGILITALVLTMSC